MGSGFVNAANDVVLSLFFAVIEPVLILLCGVLVARLADRFIKKVFGELRVDEGAERLFERKFSASAAVSALTRFVIYVVSAFVALAQAGVLVVVVRWALVALGGAAVVAVLLWAWDVVVDLYSLREASLELGDDVVIGCVAGVVVRRGWLGAVVRDGGRDVYVRNRYVRRYS